ncbi:MAG: hypothetical protein WC196_07465 [Bacilli bacterium]|jgi:hypothetical protein
MIDKSSYKLPFFAQMGLMGIIAAPATYYQTGIIATPLDPSIRHLKIDYASTSVLLFDSVTNLVLNTDEFVFTFRSQIPAGFADDFYAERQRITLLATDAGNIRFHSNISPATDVWGVFINTNYGSLPSFYWEFYLKTIPANDVRLSAIIELVGSFDNLH